MSLTKTTLGPFELYTIETGDIKLDGGAMFGVVPKTLWSRGIPADDKNRIQMTMRCLLIKSNQTGKVYLIDNGAGTKFNEKMFNIYGLDYSKHNMADSFAQQGFKYEDVTDVIFTHLHFDHCGGTSSLDEEGNSYYNFPNADYHVHKAHWETATNPNAREKASFLKENMEPLMTTDRMHFVDDNHEFEKGLTTIIVNGHTKGQQLPKIEADGRTLVFMADLLPTHVHLPLPWVMGYDMYPTVTLKEKDAFMKQAADENWLLYLEHDYYEEIIQIGLDGHKLTVTNKLNLNEL